MPFYVIDMMSYPSLKIKGKYATKSEADKAGRRGQTSHNILVTIKAKDAKEARRKAPKASRLSQAFFKIKTLV